MPKWKFLPMVKLIIPLISNNLIVAQTLPLLTGNNKFVECLKMGKIMNYPLGKMVANKGAPEIGEPVLINAVRDLKILIEREFIFGGNSETRKLIHAADLALMQARGAERKIFSQQQRILEMEHLALNDSLTNALNRRGLEDELERVLSAAERYDETGVLVFIDLDDFKPINDTYGHGAGDIVLQKVAELLKANIRPHDSVGRLGGDEFAVILSRTDWQSGQARAEMLERTINNAIVHWNRAPIAIRASFGFECFKAKTNADVLMGLADAAMYKAKRARAETSKQMAEEDELETRETPIITKKMEKIFKGEASA